MFFEMKTSFRSALFRSNFKRKGGYFSVNFFFSFLFFGRYEILIFEIQINFCNRRLLLIISDILTMWSKSLSRGPAPALPLEGLPI